MKRNRLAACFIAFVVGSTALIIACSSDSTSNPPGSSGTSGTPSGVTTVHVSAAAGGTVADPSGKTTLTIPPGALAKDMDITLALSPATAGAVVDVSEFGPDGLTFLKPVTLAIKADASLAPTGKALSLATFDGTAFKAIDGSMYAAGAATGSIMHFSKYSIVLIDGKVVLQPPASCTAAISAFKPCGGDPKGTWTFADFCLPGQTLGNDPFGGKCPGFSEVADLQLLQDVTIGATNITIADGTVKQDVTLNIPLSCANSDGDGGTVDGGPADCAALQTQLNKSSSMPNYTCTDKGGGVCACVAPTKTSPNAGSTSTYTTSGTTLTTTDSKGKMGTAQYCVDNNLLTVAGSKDGGIDTLYTLNRK